jgi:hypothetical protein
MGKRIHPLAVSRPMPFREHAADFYVYGLFRPIADPFYIGKGRGYRWAEHEQPSKLTRKAHKENLIKKLIKELGYLPRKKLCENLTEDEALIIECTFIAELGRVSIGTGSLLNETDGGEGASNPSPDIRLRRSIISKEIASRPGVRERRSAAVKAARATPLVKAKFAAYNNNPETRERRRQISKSLWENHDFRLNQSIKRRQLWESPEYKLRMIEIAREAHNRPEVKKKTAATNALPEVKARRSKGCRAREARRQARLGPRNKMIIELYKKGESVSFISDRCGCSPAAIYEVVRLAGVHRKPLRGPDGKILSRKTG